VGVVSAKPTIGLQTFLLSLLAGTESGTSLAQTEKQRVSLVCLGSGRLVISKKGGWVMIDRGGRALVLKGV